MAKVDLDAFNDIDGEVLNAKTDFMAENENFVNDQVQMTTASTGQMALSSVLFIIGGALMLYNAFTIAYNMLSYYYPDYKDIPLFIVLAR